jgi:Holliday junction resolvase
MSQPVEDFDQHGMAYLVAEALQDLDWSGDSAALMRRLATLAIGLPAEDELIFILSWLGRCVLAHKLDQPLASARSSSGYRVPDILAIFEYQGRQVPVLIEVKAYDRDKLKWKEDYLLGLQRYAATLGLPLLVAWRRLDLWYLVDARCFRKARTNFHLDSVRALKENLLGLLAGDFLFVAREGVVAHVEYTKDERMLDPEGRVTWRGRKRGPFLSGPDGKRIERPHAGFLPILLASKVHEETIDEGTHYSERFVVQQDTARWAQTAIRAVILSAVEVDGRIPWRRILRDGESIVQRQTVREAADAGLADGLMDQVVDLFPQTTPDFLEPAPADGWKITGLEEEYSTVKGIREPESQE